jgi:hypothetical protein
MNAEDKGGCAMPSEEQMRAVGETCTEYWPVDEGPASCSNCSHWKGDELKCELDIFELQLTNLDQT